MQYTNYTTQQHIATITICNERHLNPLNTETATELCQHLETAAQDPNIKIIILTGAGRAFSAGGDLRFFRDCIQNNHFSKLNDMLATVQNLILSIRFHPKIIIAAVHGHAAGGGANLALAADYIIAADNAVLTQSFVHIGLAPDAGGIYFLSRTIGAARAFALCADGRPLSAKEAYNLGIVHAVHPLVDFSDAITTFAENLCHAPQSVLRAAKEENNMANYQNLPAYFEEEARILARSFASPEFAEGVQAFLEKRRPDFTC